MSRPPIRIAVLYFCHETVTFLPNDTMRADFLSATSPAAGEAMLAWDREAYLGGFMQVAHEHDGVSLVGIESPYWPRTGTGSGWITTDAYEHFVGRMIAGLQAQGPFDGVYLALHGAMGVRGIPRPEAELARRVRAVLGPSCRIAGTFDPHGNEDVAFLEQADFAFTVKYFPHYDAHLQGERAARMLIRAIRGDYTPAHAVRKVPILSPTVMQWTGAAPWMDLVQRALVWEARKVDAYVNVFFGFPWADVPDAGMTIQVTTNGRPELANVIATDMAATAWRMRQGLVSAARVLRMGEGVAAARQAVVEGRGPVVLADHSDRSGYATWLLRELIAQQASRVLIGTIADGPTVAALLEAGVKPSDVFDREIGGRVDASAGAPVRIAGTVRAVAASAAGSPENAWIAVSFGAGNVLVLSAYLAQVTDPAELAEIGLDAADFDIIAIKSRVHFRRGFDDNGFAGAIFLVEPDEPFLGTVRLEALPYRHLDITRFYPYRDGAYDPAAE